MDEYLKNNQDLWDEITPIHARSEFYDLEGFKAGKSTLVCPIEIEEMGDVSGKSLLHLQCHFGMDTLFWTRRGARATTPPSSAVWQQGNILWNWWTWLKQG